MPPTPPKGMGYGPRNVNQRPAFSQSRVEPRAVPPVPAAPVPGLPAPPAYFYPSAGPTVESWMIGQMGNMPVLDESHTFTAVQTYQLSDHATGPDSPALRPALAYFDHLTDQTPGPGI